MRSRIETREERGDGGANVLPRWNDAPGQMWLGPTAWIVGMMAQRKFRSWHPGYSRAEPNIPKKPADLKREENWKKN
jgi:hypothetical protein